MFHKMNDKWTRQEHFRHYMDNVRCTYSLTVQIDITKLHIVLKSNNIKAYPVQIFLISSIVNLLPEFRMSISDQGEPGYWEVSHPSYTIFNNDTKTFSSIWTPYEKRFSSFYKACLKDIRLYSKSTAFAPKHGEPPNIFTVSSVPWIDFTAFNLNVYGDGTYLSPIFTIGKYVEHTNRTFMPIAMQLHHSACDGYHVGQFVEALQEMVQKCDDWLYKY